MYNCFFYGQKNSVIPTSLQEWRHRWTRIQCQSIPFSHCILIIGYPGLIRIILYIYMLKSFQIRDKILKNVIFDQVISEHEELHAPYSHPHWNRKKIRKRDLTNARLVNIDWLDSTTRLLRYQREPLIIRDIRLPVQELVPAPTNWLAKCWKSLRDSVVGSAGNDYYEKRAQRLFSLSPFVILMTDSISVYAEGDNGALQMFPFSLKLWFTFFHQRSQQTLITCLTQFGPGLIELQFQFPVDATMIVSDFPPLALPYLRKLTVNIDETLLDGNVRFEEVLPVPAVIKRDFKDILQLLLDATRTLRILKFNNSRSDNVFQSNIYHKTLHNFPENFQEIKLPATLYQIDFEHPLQRPEDIEILLAPHNPLPHLTRLTLYAGGGFPFPAETLNKILEKWSRTLSKLTLLGQEWREVKQDQERIPLEFPVMSQLRTLHLLSSRWMLSPSPNMERLRGKLPKLESLALRDNFGQEFQHLTRNIMFTAVRKLRLINLRDGWQGREENEEVAVEWDPSANDVEVYNIYYGGDVWIINEDGDDAGEDYGDEEQIMFIPRCDSYSQLPSSLETMQSVRKGFPNLVDLSVAFVSSPEIMSGFKYLFQELNQLKFLKLTASGHRVNMAGWVPKYIWDSIFTGLSLEKVEELRQLTNEELEKKAEEILSPPATNNGSGDDKIDVPSIRKMTQLEYLYMGCHSVKSTDPQGMEISHDGTVLSKVVFAFGFMRVPKLRKLVLAGGFRPTTEMEELWKAGKENATMRHLEVSM